MKMRSILALAALLALAPRIILAHGGTEVIVNGEVRADSLIEIEGEEFAPNDDVRIELLRDGTEPIELGRVRTDAEGKFLASLHVPPHVEAGLYRLEAVGVESASADVTVLSPSGDGDEPAGAAGAVSSDRPVGETVVLAVAAAVLAIAGAGLVWFSRTRPHREDRAAGA